MQHGIRVPLQIARDELAPGNEVHADGVLRTGGHSQVSWPTLDPVRGPTIGARLLLRSGHCYPLPDPCTARE